jgi:hypothetical protein
MIWSKLNFGKHVGRTLPQVVLSDPNWFFWAHRKRIFCDRVAIDPKSLAARATHIGIPKRHPRDRKVEYRHDSDDRFLGFDFVEADGSGQGAESDRQLRGIINTHASPIVRAADPVIPGV